MKILYLDCGMGAAGDICDWERYGKQDYGLVMKEGEKR